MVSCQQQYNYDSIVSYIYIAVATLCGNWICRAANASPNSSQWSWFLLMQRAPIIAIPCLGFWIINGLHSQDEDERSQSEL